MRFHRLVKYTYLNKATNGRIDFLVKCLIDLVEDKRRQHKIVDARSLCEGKSRITENIKRYKRSIGASTRLLRLGQSKWEIKSFTDERWYIITMNTCPCPALRK
ncbi:hypothetical protein Y032_0111g212 [Ancylostoma ceylanicum]|uniref:Uncharacterized protein n=1 Tax=Ancylostoma ceylanicum TaxID=53326 RepID=A0A016TE26_9BILA|nr:hypothetical protein Y032_0111g212 [Ancylostoma ceylanicum]